MTDVTQPPPASTSRKRVRVEYTADFAYKIDKLLENQTRLEVSIEALRGSIMPRQEIDGELEKRVPLTIYTADKLNNEERFKRLEDAPSATWARAGILISGGIGCMGLLLSVVSIFVGILIASHIIG